MAARTEEILRAGTVFMILGGCGLPANAPGAHPPRGQHSAVDSLPEDMSAALLRAFNQPLSTSETLAFNAGLTGADHGSNLYSDLGSGAQVQAVVGVDAAYRVDVLTERSDHVKIVLEGYLGAEAVMLPEPLPRHGFTTSMAWETIDLSAIEGIPADAVFGIVEADGTATRPPRNAYGLRYPGAPDARSGSYSAGHGWSVVPLGPGLRFEAFMEDVDYCYLNIVGAITAGVARTSGGEDLAPAIRDGTWQTVDLSPLATPPDARFAVVELYQPGNIAFDYALRPHGATRYNDLYWGVRGAGGLQLVPLVEQRFEIRLQAGSTLQAYCWGFVQGGGWINPVQIPDDQLPGGPVWTTVDLDQLLASAHGEDAGAADADAGEQDSAAPADAGAQDSATAELAPDDASPDDLAPADVERVDAGLLDTAAPEPAPEDHPAPDVERSDTGALDTATDRDAWDDADTADSGDVVTRSDRVAPQDAVLSDSGASGDREYDPVAAVDASAQGSALATGSGCACDAGRGVSPSSGAALLLMLAAGARRRRLHG